VPLLVAVVAVGLLGGPAAAATSGGGRVHTDLAAAFVGQINAARASHGRPRLVVDATLTSVARGWALSMSKTSVLSHNPRLVGSVRGWRFLGENVGVGYSLASLEQAFWASAPHRADMLDPDFTRVGVGVVDDGGKLWVVEDFSRPAGATRRPARRARPRTHHVAATPHRRAVHRLDGLAAQCAVQSARLFQARHWSRQAVAWHRPA
jgi:cysteine-rich secretory family protein